MAVRRLVDEQSNSSQPTAEQVASATDSEPGWSSGSYNQPGSRILAATWVVVYAVAVVEVTRNECLDPQLFWQHLLIIDLAIGQICRKWKYSERHMVGHWQRSALPFDILFFHASHACYIIKCQTYKFVLNKVRPADTSIQQVVKWSHTMKPQQFLLIHTV